jgi:hypothetical protein
VKETLRKTGMKQLISSVQQHSCILVTGGQRVPCHAQCDSFVRISIFLASVTAKLSFFSQPKWVLNGQQFASAEEVTTERQER